MEKVIIEYGVELKEIRRELADLKKQITGVDETAKDSANKTQSSLNAISSNVSGKLSASFRALGGIIAAVFSVRAIGNFITSTIQLATEAQEVKAAFEALNSPILLANLRNAVGGTLSDLKLMGLALKANNLQIPLKELGKILEFAKIRADELGQSTEQVAETIIQGIGAKSTRALVAVGISQKEFGTEIKKTKNYYEALNNVIDKTLENAGEQTESVADKQERLRANIENTKVEIGQRLLPVLDVMLSKLSNGLNKLNNLFDFFSGDISDRMEKIRENVSASGMTIEKATDQISNNERELKFLIDRYGDLSEVNAQQTKLFNKSKAEAAFTQQSLKMQNQAIQEYIDLLNQKTVVGGVDEDQEKERQKLIEKNIESVKKFVEESQNMLKLFVDFELITPAVNNEFEALLKQFDASETPIETVSINVGNLADALLKAYENSPKLKDGIKGVNDEIDLTNEELEQAIDGLSKFRDAFIGVIESVNEAFQAGSDYRMDLLEHELETGQITQRQFDIQSRRLKTNEAIRDRNLAVFNIVLDTARAIMAFLAEGNPVLSVLAGVQGGIQLGTVLATPLPKFAKGKVAIQGAGTETSDSIMAMLSKGETITTAKMTKKYRPVLEAIHKDKFDKYVMEVYMKGKSDRALEWDDYRLRLAIMNGTYEQRQNTQHIIRAINHRKTARF